MWKGKVEEFISFEIKFFECYFLNLKFYKERKEKKENDFCGRIEEVLFLEI